MAHYKGTNKEGKKAEDLARSRQQMAEDFQAKIEAIKRENAQGLKNMDESFQSTTSVLDEAFKASTVGLVTADDFRKKREQLEQAKKAEAERDELAARRAKKKREAERKAKLSTLSFDTGEVVDENEEQEKKDAEEKEKEREEQAKKKRKVGKNPDVDTSFLRDPEREAEEARLREQLAKEYAAQQEKIKQEMIEVTYSYWDGSGHRRSITVTKGTRIDQFLEKCRRDLSDAFHELRGTSSENLIYVKEDLIIPHHYTFYDLIVTKARGKSGPLFHFDVHDDVRLTMNAHVEKDESHAGKVLTRAYYERNKHIFPASRWEMYDPSVKRDKYTIG